MQYLGDFVNKCHSRAPKGSCVGRWMGVHTELGHVCLCMDVTFCRAEHLREEDQPVIAEFHLVSHFVLNSNHIRESGNVSLWALQPFYCSHINPQCIQNPDCPSLK